MCSGFRTGKESLAASHNVYFTVQCEDTAGLLLQLKLRFLPRDATQSAVLLWQAVCLSVCP